MPLTDTDRRVILASRARAPAGIRVPEPEEFLGACLRHGVLGLAYPRLYPGEARDLMFQAYATEASNTLAHMSLLRKLRASGIPFLPFKGASLVERGLYAPEQRPLLDIDLLVPRQRLGDMEALLAGMGFSRHPYKSPTGIALHKGRVNVDLHTVPFPPELHIPPRLLWARAKRGFLCPEDEMILVACHAAKSVFTSGLRLIWKRDLERLAGIAHLGRALKLARSLGVERCLVRLVLSDDEDFMTRGPRPSRLGKLAMALGAGANRGQRFLCLIRAGARRMVRTRTSSSTSPSPPGPFS